MALYSSRQRQNHPIYLQKLSLLQLLLLLTCYEHNLFRGCKLFKYPNDEIKLVTIVLHLMAGVTLNSLLEILLTDNSQG